MAATATIGFGRTVPFNVLPSRWAGAEADSLVFAEGYIPGRAPAMQELYEQMRALLRGDVPVLFLGETGVGKEQLARALHASSERGDGPFVAVNCAAIPADLLEAELFGIGKGVATGVNERPGMFQLAKGGTLFLDEIGDMPLTLQAKLLRALQGREIQPVGGAPVRLDVRVITATNSDLDQKIEQGQFRRDLYYRVAGFVLRVPSLRERREDIPELVQARLSAFAREAGVAAPAITMEAQRALTEYAWPGNVRELEHEVRRLAYLSRDGQAVDARMLSERIVLRQGEAEMPPSSLRLDANVDHLERRLIRAALLRASGKRSGAARLLGISRNGLAMKMERLGIGAALAAVLMILPACGGSSNPMTSTSPSPTPPPVTRSTVIDDDAFAVPAKFAVPDVWMTTSTGTVEVTVDWTFASNDVDIFVARGSEPCTLQTLNNRTCGFVATEESTTMKPEKLTMPNLAAGTYTLYVVNFGSTDESVACHIVLTTTSAASVRPVTTGGAASKGRVIEIRPWQ